MISYHFYYRRAQIWSKIHTKHRFLINFARVGHARSRRLSDEIHSNQNSDLQKKYQKVHFRGQIELISWAHTCKSPTKIVLYFLANVGTVQGAGCSIQQHELKELSLSFSEHQKFPKKSSWSRRNRLLKLYSALHLFFIEIHQSFFK